MTEPLDYDAWKKTYAVTIAPEVIAGLKAFHPTIDPYAEVERALEREYSEYVTNFWRTKND